jgi:hypothetical protein
MTFFAHKDDAILPRVYIGEENIVQNALCAILATSLFAVLTTGNADTLIIDSMQQGGAEQPSRGMSKKAVETTWGEPSVRRGGIGAPPISRWEYPGFVVYFEYDNVVHAVSMR